MHEIVIVSGKGGTGKTSLTAGFALLGGKDVLLADCDVDAADMHLLVQPDFREKRDFYSGERAQINEDGCTACGECSEVCRFDAIWIRDGIYGIDAFRCEGCGYCARVCPSGAITNHDLLAGEWFISTIKTGSKMVHARLGVGAENSGKLVTRVKNEARRIAREQTKKWVLIDGSPGIGCPVISSLSGADLALMVTEPTVSGFHDLKRLNELVKNFKIPSACIINKSDINEELSSRIIDFLKSENIYHLSNLPYDESFTDAMSQGKSIVENGNHPISDMIEDIWNQLIRRL
jgi:MinD superfamily P-loop ATPase